MKWIDKLLTAYNFGVEKATTVTVSLLDSVGSLACVLGGIAYAGSYCLDEKITASYYGAANSEGSLTVRVAIPELDFRLNDTIPFQYSLLKSGGQSVSLKDYLTVETVRTASGISIISGTAMRMLSAHLQKWLQHRLDKERLQKEYGKILDLAKPSRREYLYANSDAFCSSISYALISYSMMASIIKYSTLHNIRAQYTYPSDGPQADSNDDYNGPVTSTLVPIEFSSARNITFEVPIIHISLTMQEKGDVKALSNVTYGGGLFFEPHTRAAPPLIAPTIIGPAAYCAGTFFHKKSHELRDERILDAVRSRIESFKQREYNNDYIAIF